MWNIYQLFVIGSMVFFEISITMATKTNLTAITWAHAVNSQFQLHEALEGPVDMIEADIILATLIDDPISPPQPCMGHPPETTSDITLQQFLTTILAFNKRNTTKKGVKLDFKSTHVFNGSIKILESLWNEMNYPVWLNADILSGPVNNQITLPVDPNIFLSTCKQKFPTAVLSIGWTTRWGNNFTEGHYNDEHIDNMTAIIKDNNVMNPLTFPVRAGIAANSDMQLKNLFIALNGTNNVTLTIWSSQDDFVNIPKLKELILNIGVDKVYFDVPKEVSDKLNLSSGASYFKICQYMLLFFLMFNMIIYQVLYKL